MTEAELQLGTRGLSYVSSWGSSIGGSSCMTLYIIKMVLIALIRMAIVVLSVLASVARK